jgi:hypothetical protein
VHEVPATAADAAPAASCGDAGFREARDMGGSEDYASRQYWQKRSDMMYYRYIDYIIRTVAIDARSMIDVGSGNCPYLEWFDWIGERVSVDIGVPYESDTVRGIRGDIHELTFDGKFDLCTCLQVMEHVPDARAFGRRLLELSDLVVVSVPFEWSARPHRVPGHVHDPVSVQKLSNWMGRRPNYHQVVREPFMQDKGKRLIAIFDADETREFGRGMPRRPPRDAGRGGAEQAA